VRRLLVLLVGLALLAAGCGGGGGGGGNSVPKGAEATPEDIPGFVSFNTDFDSEQWKTGKTLLQRFPDAPRLLARIQKAFRQEGVDFERDIRPALGPELDLAWLDFQNDGDNLVGLTQPDDDAKLKALLAKGDEKTFSREVDGWTVIADSQELLSRFEQGAGSLADVDAFKEQMEKIDDASAARGYVRGREVQQALDTALEGEGAPPSVTVNVGRLESLALGAKAEEKGVSFDGGIRIDPALDPQPYKATLPADLPKGALLYVSANSLDDMLRTVLKLVGKANPNFPEQLSQVEAAMGITLEDDIYPLLTNEAAFAIYPKRPVPTFLFVLKTAGDDEENARRLTDRVAQIATLSGEVRSTKLDIEGAQVHKLDFTSQGFSLFLTVKDGKTIITNGREGVSGVLGSGDKLDDDSIFKQAKENAEMPDETTGFVYGNLEQGLPFTYAFARSQGGVVPPIVPRNTEPLEDTLLYTEKDGKRLRVAGFLTIQ
jgi:Protein of unknown function (DUF3352)